MYRFQSKYQSNLEKAEKASTLIINVLTLSGFLALFFGAFITRNYLSSIQQTAIFPDLLTSPSALLALLAVFTGGCSFILICLMTPYQIPNLLKKQYKDNFKTIKNKLYFNIFIKVDVLCLALLAISFATHKKIYWINLNKLTTITFSLMFIFLIIFYISNRCYFIENIKRTPIEFWIYYIFSYSLILFGLYYHSLLPCIAIIYLTRFVPYYFRANELPTLLMYKIFYLAVSFSIVFLSYIITYNNESANNLTFFVFTILWIVIYLLNGYLAFEFTNTKEKHVHLLKYTPILIFMFLFNFYLFSFDKYHQLSRLILAPFHFIEYPNNANWYIIDTRFFAPNNLNSQEIERHSKDLLAYFYSNQYESQCKYEKNTKKQQCEKLESTLREQQKYNRFYGYIAWNLGEIKVFCPHGYEQASLNAKKENKNNPIQCLALKAEYIIPYY